MQIPFMWIPLPVLHINLFGDSRSLRFSCVDFGWRTFYFTGLIIMKEINVNGVTILEYENEKIYSNQRCILVLNGVAAILAIIIAISYIIINTLSDSWVLSWSDYILYVEAVLMPVALFFGSLKDGGRPSRFTDIELVRISKR